MESRFLTNEVPLFTLSNVCSARYALSGQGGIFDPPQVFGSYDRSVLATGHSRGVRRFLRSIAITDLTITHARSRSHPPAVSITLATPLSGDHCGYLGSKGTYTDTAMRRPK